MLINNFFRSFRSKDKVQLVVLGHQKGGTTAIANLIGRLTGLRVSSDPLYMMDYGQGEAAKSLIEQPDVLKVFLKRRPDLFLQSIVKDPDFIFVYPSIKNYYATAKFLFVVRNPLDTIRSICNRLGLQPSVCTALTKIEDMKYGNKHWEYILSGRLPNQGDISSNLLVNLAHRWCLAAENYLNNEREIKLVKYEDFLSDKEGCIENVAHELGLSKVVPVSDYLNVQYQSKGDSSLDLKKFFGVDNFLMIGKICEKNMKKLGYELGV